MQFLAHDESAIAVVDLACWVIGHCGQHGDRVTKLD